ncbi:MAG: hypothetical protein ABIP21_03700, partial [Acidimicrobiia bacterium]
MTSVSLISRRRVTRSIRGGFVGVCVLKVVGGCDLDDTQERRQEQRDDDLEAISMVALCPSSIPAKSASEPSMSNGITTVMVTRSGWWRTSAALRW